MKSMRRVVAGAVLRAIGYDDLMPLTPGVPLAPRFTTPQPNHNLVLHEGTMELIIDGSTHAGEGRVFVDWLPSPVVRFTIEFAQPFSMPQGDDVRVRLVALNLQPRALLTTFGIRNREVTCEGIIEDFVDLGIATQLTEVSFHICNFVRYIGTGVSYPDGSNYAARLTLEGEPWRITIDMLDPFRRDERIEGYAITHCGHLERIDGQPFSRDDAVHALEDLDYFLSFVAGFWVASILPVGRDAQGATWNQWRVGRIDRQKTGFSWFNTSVDIQGLSRAYAGYRRLLANATWEDAIDYAIYWYVSARRTTDTGPAIVMVQTGLETLGWVLLVEDKRLLTPEGYEKLWASDKLRLLLGQVGVDRSVPPSFSALASSFGRTDWFDGPHLVTDHRNALVHPSPRNRARIRSAGGAQVQAEELSLYYLELSILKVLDYNGSFHNRTDAWSHEMVPWASDT